MLNGIEIGCQTVFETHFFHANDHDNKVLFTTEKVGKRKIDKFILAQSDNVDNILIGDVVGYGKYGMTSSDCEYWKNSFCNKLLFN